MPSFLNPCVLNEFEPVLEFAPVPRVIESKEVIKFAS